MPSYGLLVRFSGNLTLTEFRQFESALLKRVHEVHRPDILLDLSELEDFTLDMAWEQIRFVRAHEQDLGRMAVVVNDTWMKLGARIANIITATRPKYFSTVEAARLWLNEGN